MKVILSNTYTMIPPRQRLLFIGMLLLQLVLSIFFIGTQSLTFDEGIYYDYGSRWVKGNVERRDSVDDSKSPVVLPALVPRIIKQLTNPSYTASDGGMQYLGYGKYCMWVFVLLTSYVFLCWGYRLYGEKNWSIPLLLLLFDPLFFSYGMIIGSDLPAACMLFSLCYMYWRYCRTNGRHYLWLTGIFAGFCLVSKLSLLFLLPLAIFIFLMRVVLSKTYRVLLKQKLMDGAIIFLISLFVINAAYFFKDTGHTLSSYRPKSEAMAKFKVFAFFDKIPIPVPKTYIEALDISMRHAAIGGGKKESTFSGVFVMGTVKYDGPIWYYYMVTMWYKMPILILLLFFATLVLILVNKKLWSDAWYFLIPIFYFLSMLSLFNVFQMGIRHILLIFPFIYLSLGHVISYVIRARWKYVFYAVTGIHFVLLLRYFPHWMAYTNEFIWDKKDVSKYVCDSSIDYAQSTRYFFSFLKEHSEYKIPTDAPTVGKFAIEMRWVTCPWPARGDIYGWLRNFEPKGVYHTVVLLYNITQEDINKLRTLSPTSQADAIKTTE